MPPLDAPLVIDPQDGVHRCTLIYLHAFKSGLRGYARRSELYSSAGVRIVMPRAPTLNISCYGGRSFASWYDYLSDNCGTAEDDLDEVSLADTRSRLFALIDAECSRFECPKGGTRSAERVFIGGCSQGCGVALDVALRYPVPLAGVLGIAGHRLASTPLEKHKHMPLHFFHGAKDRVMRWSWVSHTIEEMRQAGYSQVVVEGPLLGVHHMANHELEADWIRRGVLAMNDNNAR